MSPVYSSKASAAS